MKKIKQIFVSVLTVFLSFFVKRKENWYAFGSWRGELYIDNSRYLYEYIRKIDDTCVCVWVGNGRVKSEILQHPKTKVFEKNSIGAIFALLKCKFMFCSQMHSDDLCDYNVFRKCVITYLHHGMPVKKWGADSAQGHMYFCSSNPIKKLIRKLTATDISYNWFATSSKLHEISNLSSLDYRGCKMEKNLQSGTPRNDFLINATQDLSDNIKKKYADLLQLDITKKIILYLPTFRRKGTPTRSFVEGLSDLEYEKIHKILFENDAILIEKNHFVEDTHQTRGTIITRQDIVHVDQNVNVQEMLLICDLLISDYSGAFLDYVLLDRPVIHYAYDYEDYKNNDSGLYYEIEEFAAGDVVETFDELCVSLIEGLKKQSKDHEKRIGIRNRYMSYEKGKASKTIYEQVIQGKVNKNGE